MAVEDHSSSRRSFQALHIGRVGDSPGRFLNAGPLPPSSRRPTTGPTRDRSRELRTDPVQTSRGQIERDPSIIERARFGALRFWLEQWAPRRQELWTYQVTQVKLVRAYGDSQLVDPATNIEGPYPDTGHIRFHLGIFCPVGTEIVTTYSGGYTGGFPYALRRACILQAFKLAIVSAEPEARKDLTTAELDAEILSLIAPYIR